MKYSIEKYNIEIEIDLGTELLPPSNSKKYLEDVRYWFRYDLGSWNLLQGNIIDFMQCIEDSESKEELMKYLSK